MRLRGRVASGIGDLARWMVLHEEVFAARTGVRLYPGSLNVVLDRPWHVPAQRLRLEPPEYPIGMSIVPCRIGGIDAFILRTDRNDAGDGDHSATVVEIAAPVRLRDAVGIGDGDEVEIVVDDTTTA